MAESIRVQMSLETKKELERLAKIYNCFYKEKPSFSKLLSKIGSKELAIKPINYGNKQDNLPLLILSIICPFDVNGIVAKITEIIADNQGNIFAINAKHEANNLGILKIYLSLEKYEQKRLAKLLTSIYNLNLQSIQDFNNFEKLRDTNDFLKIHSKQNQRVAIKNEEDAIQEIYKQKFVLNISCTFGIEIIVKNKSGILKFITEKIARNKFLISSLIQNFDKIKKEDIIKIFLEIKIPENKSNKITDEIIKIEEITEDLQSNKDRNCVIKVRRLDIDDIDNI
ncbi:MAG: hypothetical protein QNJ42_25740 [Crocosphaera sp.]|nr:hypothetical protein [Crocosphaera sp.]